MHQLTPPPLLMASLISGMAAERSALKNFISLLDTEQQTLLDKQSERLLTLAENKTQIVHTLGKLAGERAANLSKQGVDVNLGGIEAWLQTHLADSLPIWREIKQLAAQARAKNHLNGELIQNTLRHTQNTLAALHHAAQNMHDLHGSASGLYGPDGQSRLSAASRTLAAC